MAFSATDFKSNLTQGGARPSLFQVELQYPSVLTKTPTKKSKFFIKGTSIPASTVGSYDVFFHGRAIKVAGDRSFEPWETTIINDEDYEIRIALEEWMDLMGNLNLNTRSSDLDKTSTGGYEGEGSMYKKDIAVKQFAKNGTALHTYTFIGAFPTTVAAISLDWGTQEIEEYAVTWAYDRWKKEGSFSSGDGGGGVNYADFD
jgi:hypothetical protein